LNELQTLGSGVLQKLRQVSSMEAGAAGFKFSFKLADVGKEGGVNLAHAFTELIDQAKTNVVLIVDEVQHALGSAEGDNMLHALKATRDAINTRPGTPGYFLFLGTGSHRARVQELSVKGNQAFNGAVTHEFPVLGRDFIEYILHQVKPQLGAKAPSIAVTEEAFKRMGSRPEELMKALNVLRALPQGANPDEHLPTIAQSLGAAAADIELQKIEALGPLAEAVFSRICSIGGNVKGGVYCRRTEGVFGSSRPRSHSPRGSKRYRPDDFCQLAHARQSRALWGDRQLCRKSVGDAIAGR
jgi:hypothetical protein